MSSGKTSVAQSESTAAPETPSLEWIRDFVRQWLDAWNSHQPERILALLTDDVEIRDDSWPKTMHGHADVREFVDALWHAIPDMAFELLDGPYVIPGEPRSSFHWRGSGTFTGRMHPPGFGPTGRRWEIDGVDFQEYHHGRIRKLRVAFDMMAVSRQLGVMPAAGSRGERALATAQRGVAWAQREYRRQRSAQS